MDIDEKSCGVILFREEENVRYYLVLKYPAGHYDFPKGHVEMGESEHETALREVEEETGIKDVDLIDGFREEMYYKYKRRGRLSHKMVAYFLGKTDTESVKISHEHLDHHWLTYDDAYKKLTFENARVLLEKAENFLL